MLDLGTVSAALTSLKTASDIASLIRSSGLTLDKAETKMKLADLISALADLKIQLADVQQDLLDRDQKIVALEKQLEIKSQMTWEAPYYWCKTSDGKKDGPFCQQCHDNHGKLIRLQTCGTGYWTCKTCGQGFEDSNYAPLTIGSVNSDFNPYD